jgi:FimV-like protein
MRAARQPYQSSQNPAIAEQYFALAESAGSEMFATQLDLVRAYLEMGELAHAQQILATLKVDTSKQQQEIKALLRECQTKVGKH